MHPACEGCKPLGAGLNTAWGQTLAESKFVAGEQQVEEQMVEGRNIVGMTGEQPVEEQSEVVRHVEEHPGTKPLDASADVV